MINILISVVGEGRVVTLPMHEQGGVTALMCASGGTGNVEVARVLIESGGADVNAITRVGCVRHHARARLSHSIVL